MFDNILFDENNILDDKIVKKFWIPNNSIINKLSAFCVKNNFSRILDVGAGSSPFPNATHFIDQNSNENYSAILIDINKERFPFDNFNFDFVYSRHTLEDIYNPFFAFNEMCRISPRGYIETPSPMIELSYGVDAHILEYPYRGYIHHRYIVWTDCKDNTLYFLPKMPLIEYISIHPDLSKKIHYLANNYPIYWNNYYFWDECNKPNIRFLDFDIKDYSNHLVSAIEKSFENTTLFLERLK
jgi:hypothetical protein